MCKSHITFPYAQNWKRIKKKWIFCKIYRQCCCSCRCSKKHLTSDCQRKVAGINTNETCTTARIPFDTGSQRAYLTENLCKHLKLDTIRTENVIINTFGTLHELELEALDVVQLIFMKGDLILLKHSQLTFACSKLTIETPKKGLKYVQNWH